MEGSFEQANNRLQFKLATEHQWIRGHVQTAHRRMIDLLNAGTAPTIAAQGGTLASELTGIAPDRPDEDQIAIVADRILFAIPEEPEGAVAAPRGSHVWIIKKTVEQALLGVGPYEIFGHVHLPQGAELRRDFLSTGPEFFAVTDALIRRLDGTTSLRTQVVVVNRRQVDYAIPTAWPRRWAGPGS